MSGEPVWLPPPQWSPSLADGTTGMGKSPLELTWAQPQWSPSLADGTTRPARCGDGRAGVAAMEPVLGGRDDLAFLPRRAHDVQAAMEPVLGGRDDSGNPARTSSVGPAAMEPVLGGRDDLSAVIGPGHSDAAPQWSPSLADGTTSLVLTVLLADRTAAMEPVLGGRDDLTVVDAATLVLLPQWSPSLADGTT